MKKALAIALVSIALLITSNIYYFVDTYKWQTDTQKEILQKQSIIALDALHQHFTKSQTNILLLLSPAELNDLFKSRGGSLEAQKRIELLFSRYEEHLQELKVYDDNGNFFCLRKGNHKNLISTFGKTDELEVYSPNIFINTQNENIVYQQPLYENSKTYGYVEFDIALSSFFDASFHSFNLEGLNFQWLSDLNGQTIYNTLGANTFTCSQIDQITSSLKDGEPVALVHHITFDDIDQKVISVFNTLRFDQTKYIIAFSIPEQIVSFSLMRNFLYVGGISLFILLAIIILFYIYIKRKSIREKQLIQSEESLKKIIHFLPIGVILVNNDKKITQVNKSALRLFNYQDEDQLMHQEANDELLFDHKMTYEKSTYSSSSKKYIITTKEKQEQVILFEEIPFYASHEKYYLQVFIEVTSIDQARKSEVKANQAKSNFIANMSHELRTPLNGIIGLTDILSYSKLNKEDQKLLTTIKRSADLLLVLINDILDFSKIEAGRLEIESIPFDLEKEIDATVNSFMHEADKKGINLSWHSDIDLPNNYEGDLIRVRQILNNLISNALKFTDKGKVKLFVTSTRRLNGSPGLLISIKDTGIGIQKEAIKSIFNPFSQADESTTRKYGGTGLGITISKQLVNMMGGEIWAKSPSGLSDDIKRPGAEFAFTLPISKEIHNKLFDFNHIKHLEQIRAFVITDVDIQISTIKKNLNSLNIEYKALAPTLETIDIIRTNQRYHLIIIDQRPDFNGLEFLQELYNHRLHKHLPIIVQSSDFDAGNTSLAKRLGADLYLRKPIKLNVLKDSILKFFPNIPNKPFNPVEEHLDQTYQILLAEDNILNQRVAQNLFKNLGFKIDIANNGYEALKKIDKTNYDIVFMDLLMPEMDGLEAIKKLRKNGNACPVIAMTSSVEECEKERVLQAGMDDFITKPASLEDLSRMLTKWCKRN